MLNMLKVPKERTLRRDRKILMKEYKKTINRFLIVIETFFAKENSKSASINLEMYRGTTEEAEGFVTFGADQQFYFHVNKPLDSGEARAIIIILIKKLMKERYFSEWGALDSTSPNERLTYANLKEDIALMDREDHQFFEVFYVGSTLKTENFQFMMNKKGIKQLLEIELLKRGVF